MFLDSELSDKKGWGHSSIEQGISLADKIDVKNFLISHHSPFRNDKEIKNDQNVDQKPIKWQSKIDRASIENQSTIDPTSIENRSKINQNNGRSEKCCALRLASHL